MKLKTRRPCHASSALDACAYCLDCRLGEWTGTSDIGHLVSPAPVIELPVA